VTRRLRPLLAVLAALPALGGAGTCGLIYDIGQLQLVLDPIERVDVDSDSGALEVFAFDRNGTVVSYYLSGYDASLDEMGYAVDGEDLDVFMRKGGPAAVSADFYLEVPLGTRVKLRVADGPVKLTGVDADVIGSVEIGDLEGVKLAAPEFDVDVVEGSVDLEFVTTPNRLAVIVTVGDINITVPPGAYRCDLEDADEPALVGVTCDDAAIPELVLAAPAGAIRIEGKTP
jgi:hypothetical protein